MIYSIGDRVKYNRNGTMIGKGKIIYIDYPSPLCYVIEVSEAIKGGYSMLEYQGRSGVFIVAFPEEVTIDNNLQMELDYGN